jgi:hypothetical protein
MDVAAEIRLDHGRFSAAVARYMLYTGKSVEEALMEQARLFVGDVIKVTPPFHPGAGQGATVAKKAGEKSVAANMGRLFAEHDLIGSRRVTHLFGRTDVEGLPFIVPAPEKNPNVEAIYREEDGRAKNRRSYRYEKKRIHVDARKVRRIYRAKVKNVGWLAGGWNAAATRLGAKVPAWVRRHGSAPGQVRIDFGRQVLRIQLANAVPYGRRIGGIEKRIAFAHKKRIDAMERQIPRLLKRYERELRK